MIDRLKIWDANRQAILAALPSIAFHLWMTYYSNEDEEQESYMALETIEKKTGMRVSRRSIIRWTQWLIENKWLIDTGKTAADKYIARGMKPTAGAHQIKVYRVDDPTSAKSALDNGTSDKSAPVPLALNVSCSDSGSVYGSASDFRSRSKLTAARSHNTFDEIQEPTKTNPSGALGVSPNQSKSKTAPDGTPYPQGFDLWTNSQRLEWLAQHGLTVAKAAATGWVKGQRIPNVEDL